jgi:hypothetical protein
MAPRCCGGRRSRCTVAGCWPCRCPGPLGYHSAMAVPRDEERPAAGLSVADLTAPDAQSRRTKHRRTGSCLILNGSVHHPAPGRPPGEMYPLTRRAVHGRGFGVAVGLVSNLTHRAISRQVAKTPRAFGAKRRVRLPIPVALPRHPSSLPAARSLGGLATWREVSPKHQEMGKSGSPSANGSSTSSTSS